MIFIFTFITTSVSELFFFFLNEKLEEVLFPGKGDNGSYSPWLKYYTANRCSKRVARKQFKPSLSSTFPEDHALGFEVYNLVDIKKTCRFFILFY